jgi:diguanylate cyclase (GGDEF)-like protein/PAS domain S-box-containing protein
VGLVSDLVDRSASWRRLLEVLPEHVLVTDEHDTVVHARVRAASGVVDDDDLVGRTLDDALPEWLSDGRSARRDDVLFLTLALEGRTWTVAAFVDSGDDARDSRQRIEMQFAAAQVIAESEERFRHSFADNMAPMMFTDLENRITEVNSAFCRMIGRSREELLGSDSSEFTYPEDLGISESTHRRMTTDDVGQLRYVKRYLHKDGRVIVVEISKSTARDAEGNILYFVISERDITEERALGAQLAHQSLHDPLTGLANRAVFEDRLTQAQARLARRPGLAAVLLMDLDDFKGVNDTHGHIVSDHVIVTIAHRLEEVTRSSDTLCRLSGDEFLYLAEGLTTEDEAEQLALRLLEVFTQPIPVPGAQLEVHASVGVVVWDGATEGFQRVIQHADSAMYEAKRRGKGHYVLYTPDLEQQSVSRFALAQELRHALHAGELSMHYQPILDLVSGEVTGFEALMRWRHPERGFVPPNVFIPLAEQSELILELGAFALRESVREASTWPVMGTLGAPFVTVNLSSRQFHDPALINIITSSLATHGLAPERLVVEITESVTLLDVAETLGVLEQLQRRDIAVALDDFGTGYSSLSYLALLRPAILKIDRSFVSPPEESDHNDTLLQMIVSLGQRLKMTVLAEGVETTEQLSRLRALGCDLAQGFLFSPAVPAPEVANTRTRPLG